MYLYCFLYKIRDEKIPLFLIGESLTTRAEEACETLAEKYDTESRTSRNGSIAFSIKTL